MRPGQTLADLTAAVLGGLDPVLARVRPDWVLVQGDTTTAMAASLAAFYRARPGRPRRGGAAHGRPRAAVPGGDQPADHRRASPTPLRADGRGRPATCAARAFAGERIAGHRQHGDRRAPGGRDAAASTRRHAAGRRCGERPAPRPGHRPPPRELRPRHRGDLRGARRRWRRGGDVEFVYPVHLNPERSASRSGGCSAASRASPCCRRSTTSRLVWLMQRADAGAHRLGRDPGGGARPRQAGARAARDRPSGPRASRRGRCGWSGPTATAIVAAATELLDDADRLRADGPRRQPLRRRPRRPRIAAALADFDPDPWPWRGEPGSPRPNQPSTGSVNSRERAVTDALWVVGAGGHAKVVIDAARRAGDREVAGVLDDDPGPLGRDGARRADRRRGDSGNDRATRGPQPSCSRSGTIGPGARWRNGWPAPSRGGRSAIRARSWRRARWSNPGRSSSRAPSSSRRP